MNLLEKKILSILEDLKENHQVSSIKAEFGAEGTRLEEALRLKDFCAASGLNLTLKVGGCEAVRDMYDARDLGINSLVTPMIETSYALKKFINSVKTVFSAKEQADITFYINIETYTGYINLKSITETEEFNFLKGIVLGRSDMAASMDIPRDELDSDKMLNIAEEMSYKMKNLNKDMIVGGRIQPESAEFLKKLPYLTHFETRKIIFDNQNLSDIISTKNGILKAIDFERLWIINRRENYNIIKNNDNERLQFLEKLLNEGIKI